VALWEELQQAHAARWLAKQGKAKVARPESAADRQKLSAGERKRLEAQEREAQRKSAEQRRARREEIKLDWYRWLIARKILSPETSCEQLYAFAIEHDLTPVSHAVLRRLKVRRARDLAPPDLAEAFGECCARMFVDADGVPAAARRAWQGRLVPDDQVEQLARDLRVDVEEAWQGRGQGTGDRGQGTGNREQKNGIGGQLGPFSEAYWEAHDREELAEVCRRAKFPPRVCERETKGALVKLLLALGGKLPMPKGLALKGTGTKRGRR
jgi:hypothetical protein